jgi:hypothetical protein
MGPATPVTSRLAPEPSFEFIGRIEDITFGGGSDPSDGFCGWNPKRGS